MATSKRKPDPAVRTHAFCITKGIWLIIKNYAIEQCISYSAAMRELILIAWEKIKADRGR